MATFTLTYSPIELVLKNGGQMPFKELAENLMDQNKKF